MFKEKFMQLLQEKEFLAFRKDHQSAYLTHVFYLADDLNKQDMQFGFYDPEQDHITTFVFEHDFLSVREEKDIFRQDKQKLVPVDDARILIDVDDVLRIVNAFQKEHYPKAQSMKKILILQTLPLGTVWNVTFVLHTFQTLNMKVNAETGDVKEHTCISLISDVK